MNATRIASSNGGATGGRRIVANISRVADRIWTGGDLPSHLGDAAMLADLADYQLVGITHILDNRIECSDEAFVEAHAPRMTYWWNGQDDAGQAMPDEWFYDGVDFALEALKDPNAQVLAHCHMGINRGPSMAFAILLATGMAPAAALDAIRKSRPIAAISYADDALDWWHRMTETPAAAAKRERAEVAAWHRRNPIDVVRIIRTIRSHEDNGRPLSA
jgi:dual specificity phosphatase 3